MCKRTPTGRYSMARRVTSIRPHPTGWHAGMAGYRRCYDEPCMHVQKRTGRVVACLADFFFFLRHVLILLDLDGFERATCWPACPASCGRVGMHTPHWALDARHFSILFPCASKKEEQLFTSIGGLLSVLALGAVNKGQQTTDGYLYLSTYACPPNRSKNS